FEISSAAIRVGPVTLQFLQVMPGGERRSIGRQDNRAHARFLRNRRERVTECSEERLRQTVARFGPVECQNCDAFHVFAQEDQRRSGCNAGSGGWSVY